MEALGRLFNAGTSATTANTRFSLVDAAGVTIFLIGATSGNATIQEHNAASGGTSQNFAGITRYWTQNNGVWTAVTQAAAATVTAATGGLLAVEIDGTSLSDGFTHISASHASGSFVVVTRDLLTQRWPANLRDLRA